MKKLLILLAAGLLLLGAAMPRLVGEAQDHATLSHSGYSDIRAVQLNWPALSGTDKLSILSHAQPMDIAHTQASMTQEEVFAAVEREMTLYEDAGIFRWFETTLQMAVPKLGIDGNDVNRFLVHWTVTYINKTDPSRSLMVDLDDESGKILSIRYDVFYETYSMDGVWERNRATMDAFTEIYFSQLDVTPPDYEYFERDGGVSSALYRFEEFAIEFFTEGAGGFYLYFPE